MEFISEISGKNDKVKWLVSSRNEPEIERILQEHSASTRLSLELNAKSVVGAVEAYINYKISELSRRYRKVYGGRKDPRIRDKLQIVQDDVADELR